MKKGRIAINQLTYQFEVPATDFRKDAYRKLLGNKKIKNFILREYKRSNDKNVFNGYITSQRPVLITTFKMWLNCTDNQLWPVYPSPEFLSAQRDNPKIVYFKYNGIERPNINDEYIVEPYDFEDVEVEEESIDSEWDELLKSDDDDIDENGRRISYREKTIQYAKELNQITVKNMDPYDIEHYVQYCHRRNWNVNRWINWIWGAYAVHIRGDPTRFELNDYNDRRFMD